ncbi:MAG: transposase [Xanthomonadaceae bacterium]|nr:transposase [Xanthomonadaceae bacterium]
MKKQTQLSLFSRTKESIKVQLAHGGSLRQGKRKIARPFDHKRALHIVLRAEKAKGEWSLLNPKHQFKIRAMIVSFSRLYGISVYELSVNGNQVHLLIRAKTRKAFQSFLRRLTGAISMLVTGAKKGNPVGRFLEQLAFSRVVSWGREYKVVFQYVKLNLVEGLTGAYRDDLVWVNLKV